MGNSSWERDRAHLAERGDRVTALAHAAVESSRQLNDHWRSSLSDVLAELEHIVIRDAHPDDVARARRGIAAVAKMFHTSDQVEDAYLGDGPV